MVVYGGPDITTDGLVLHLDAANIKSYPGNGSTWYDLSGNNKNFTWFTTPSFTSGVIPYFSTLGNRCTGPASNSFGITNTSGYTIFLICMQNSLVATSSFQFYSSTAVNSRGIFAHCTWSDNVVYFDQGGCCNSDTRTSVVSGGSQSWNIWAFRRLTNSSIRSILKNGSILTTNSDTALDINLTTTGVDIGGSNQYGGNSSSWDARLQGFTVYNRGLTDIEILNNVRAIKGRFGL